MLKSNVELAESFFVHRKSKVHLLTRTAATVLRKSADHLVNAASASHETVLPCHLWLPRTRAFRLSFQFHLADDVVLTPKVSHNLDSIIAELIEGAELWAQLGYQVSQVSCHKPGDSDTEGALKVDFEVQSQPDFDAQPWSPARVDSWELEVVELRFRFTGGCGANADNVELPAIPKQTHEHIESPVGSLQHCGANSLDEGASLQSKISASCQRSRCAYAKQEKQEQPVLDEDVFWALFDAGFRSSICSKPVRLARSIKLLTDGGVRRLCDLAPAMFVPNYVQRLQQAAQHIPSISRQLLSFVNLAQPIIAPTSGGDVPRLAHGSHEIDRTSSQNIQKHLWNTVTSGIDKNGPARRLRPLKHSGITKMSDTMFDFSDLSQQSWQARREPSLGLDCNSNQASHCGARSEDDLLDFCLNLDDQADICFTSNIPMVATEGASCTFSMAHQDSHDVEVASDRQRMNPVLYDCLFEQEESAAPLQYESRKYSNSISQMSDVSMLLAFEAPMIEGRPMGQAQTIGGSSWLTQNVIRMHPLRQQQRENDEVHPQDSAGIGHGLYERPDRSWWSETSDASEAPLEDYHQARTKSQLDDICLSPSFSSKEDGAAYIEETLDDFGREGFMSGRTTPMSTRQVQDNSSSSLAEVIGNDHLLWHMWKRRASVAPRGEEDVTDMKILFATDPDMKLFSSRWDLDPSDLSSSSNEDPMLQETGYDQSPRNKATSPMTPNSERRSYFTPPRSPSSASSSGYVGRSSADPSRRSSLIKRFTWGGRRPASQGQALDLSKLEQRTMEVKRRKTLDDYESMDREASNDDSSDMLF